MPISDHSEDHDSSRESPHVTPWQIQRPELRRFVSGIRRVSFSRRTQDSHLPDLGLVAAFHIRGATRLEAQQTAPSAALTGLYDRLRRHEHGEGSQVLIVNFTDIGAAALLRLPADEARNTTVDFRAMSRRFASCWDMPAQLAELPDDKRRQRLVERWLMGLFQDANPDALIERAAIIIKSRKGRVRIDQLAKGLGLSESAFTRRFRAVVGVPPKRYAAIVRIQNVLRIARGEHVLTRVALEAGYFDQAHFIHEFRAVTGQAPGDLLKSED